MSDDANVARKGRTTPFKGLPRGSRDLLPPACRGRRLLTSSLIETFETWGYDQVMTPTVEYFDVLALGLTAADKRMCVRFIEPGSGEVVALRADVTPQIARMVGHRLGGEMSSEDTVRLCYAADVVRLPGSDRQRTEHHQVGVELVGDPEPAADAELLALCSAALSRAGLTRFRLDLAHREVALAVMDALELESSQRDQLRALWARKDRGGVGELLAGDCASEAARRAAIEICDLYGPPSVLTRARAVLDAAGATAGLDRLEAVLGVLAEIDPEAHRRVSIDLGEVRGFDYYSGLRLRVWAPGGGRPIVRGGRYDDLLARYGPGHPATGFAVDLDALEAALEEAGRSGNGADPRPVTLVVVDSEVSAQTRTRAAMLARDARARGARAWVSIGTAERCQTMGTASGATELVWVGEASGEASVRSWRRDGDQWIADDDSSEEKRR